MFVLGNVDRKFWLTTLALLLVAALPTFVKAQPILLEGDVVPSQSEVFESAGPAVVSEEFPDSDLWYSSQSGMFTWEVPDDVEVIAVELATTSDREPLETFRPPITEFTVSEAELNEGVQYLLLQFKEGDEWTEVTARPIKIDNTAPQSFAIVLNRHETNGDWLNISFKAEDSLSGVAYYELYIDDEPPVTLSTAEAEEGYTLRDIEDQSYYVHVVAYDQAQNGTVSSLAVVGTEAVNEAIGLLLAGYSPEALLIALLSTIILILFGYLMAERRRYAYEEERLKQELVDIQVQMTKIFKALRDEIYDQVRSITKKKKLSRGEQEAVDGLNKALEVSETLIDKEVKDVEKLLD